uniref:RNA polymerase sigma-70 domain-containing protein n=1 Tax=Rhizochromulina marina TaxID=1034831 RepID=A0A7S2WVH4_9STRA|mmetsp:Transcript_8411/g.23915  ORF Transcript_8411/g.23915 Transcript_8411/m.23915 type:complete len:542 (+) Transcript_8411:209-1834(+)
MVSSSRAGRGLGWAWLATLVALSQSFAWQGHARRRRPSLLGVASTRGHDLPRTQHHHVEDSSRASGGGAAVGGAETPRRRLPEEALSSYMVNPTSSQPRGSAAPELQGEELMQWQRNMMTLIKPFRNVELERQKDPSATDAQLATRLGYRDVADMRRAIQVGSQAREEMILRHLPIVFKYQRKYAEWAARRGLSAQELFQEGSVALVRVLDRFTDLYPEGFKATFGSYVQQWVKADMLRAINEQRHGLRVPGHFMRDFAPLKRIRDELSALQGREVTLEEWAEHVNVPAQTLASYLERDRVAETLSLSKPHVTTGTTLESQLVAQGDSPESAMSKRDINEVLLSAINALPERDAELIRLRFGVGRDGAMDQPTMTQRDVAELWGRHQPEISALEAQALDNLREALRLDSDRGKALRAAASDTAVGFTPLREVENVDGELVRWPASPAALTPTGTAAPARPRSARGLHRALPPSISGEPPHRSQKLLGSSLPSEAKNGASEPPLHGSDQAVEAVDWPESPLSSVGDNEQDLADEDGRIIFGR